MLHSHRIRPFHALVFAITGSSAACSPTATPDDMSQAETGGFAALGGAFVGGAASGGTGGTVSSGGALSASGGAQAISGGSTSTGGNPLVGGASAGGASAGGAQGDGGQGTGGATPAASWVDIKYMLNASCASCHGPGAKVNLSPDDSPNEQLHRTMTTYKVPECGNALLVSPGHPEDSAFLKLLNLECTKDGEPFIMPQSCGIAPCFPEDWMQRITLWIEGGALAQ
jgi:hypothetical protein